MLPDQINSSYTIKPCYHPLGDQLVNLMVPLDSAEACIDQPIHDTLYDPNDLGKQPTYSSIDMQPMDGIQNIWIARGQY